MTYEVLDDFPELPDVQVSRDFKHADRILVKRFMHVKEDYERDHPGKQLMVSCTYRSTDEQWRLFQQGRFGDTRPQLTQMNGRDKRSKHNNFPSLALDCFVLNGGKALWDENYYWPLLNLCKKYGLISGGAWSRFPDWPHIELPEDDLD